MRHCKRGPLSAARLWCPGRDREALLLPLRDAHSAVVTLLALTPVPRVTPHGIAIPLAGRTNQAELKSAGIVLQRAVKDSPRLVPMKVSRQKDNFKARFCATTNFLSEICGRKE